MRKHKITNHRAGFALITVVLVLAALMLLCTPFLLTARNADQASQQLFHRAEAKIALDNASTHARARLERTHPAFDASLYADSLDELAVGVDFQEDFLDARDAQGVMWDVETFDVAGQIDLGSAPPQVIGAILGAVTRLVAPVLEDDDEISLASVSGLDPEGFIWVGGELVRYEEIKGNKLLGVERGLGARFDADENPLPGPLPAIGHGVGATVMDQRAFAPVEWRLFDGDVRGFDSYEQLEEVNQYASEENQLGPDHFERLTLIGSVFGGVGAGARWQRAARMISSGERDVTGDLRVDSVRWFNAGSTIQISSGSFTELAIVRSVGNNGLIRLDRPLSGDYDAYEAEVRVLARRPVNINSASHETLEILMRNLKMRGRNSRITGSEAKAMADLIVESRPFEGFEDFMKRIVLPAAGIEPLPGDAPLVPDVFAQDGSGMGSVIDGYDAVALYRNALNANDFQLEYSTMPFSFTSNNVHDIVARTVINGKSGVERFSAIREETHVVIPQDELLHVWGTQEDYDMLLRLNREAPYWMSGPEATSRNDHGTAQPPTRVWAHLGTHNGSVYIPGVINQTGVAYEGDLPSPEHVFADRDPDGYVQLFHHPVDSQADPGMNGRVINFTHETRNSEGRYLPDQTIVHAPGADRVQWDDKQGIGLLRGFNYSFWVKPVSHEETTLLDVGGSSEESDRVSILFEGGDLVVRALDGGGDHRDSRGNPILSEFKEQSELRYSLAPSEEGAGLPVDTWHHIEVDLRGTRPNQMMMMVNGLSHGVRTPGMTKLSASVGEFDSLIPVDSTEGFPPIGVVRIGSELIEYRLSGDALEALYIEEGPDAGFGGRNARVRWSAGDAPGVSDPPAVPINYDPNRLIHPQGATVELYGYAHALRSDVPGGEGSLPTDLGSFRVGVVNGVIGGPTNGEEVNVRTLFGSLLVGTGIRAEGSEVTSLLIGNAENPDDESADVSAVMAGFSQQGGYALLIQGELAERTTESDGAVGGWSVIRYSGWNGNTLEVAAWGNEVPELVNLSALDEDEIQRGGGNRSFVSNWTAAFVGAGPIQELHNWRLFIVPCSLAVTGSSTSFLPATKDEPQFVQLSEEASNELTEWICYNQIIPGSTLQLVRDDPRALEKVWAAVVGPARELDIADPQGDGDGPGSGQGGQMMMAAAAPEPPAGPPTSPQPLLDFSWQPVLGEPEDLEPEPDGYPITRAAREAFQFRGVMGTYPHDHRQGVTVRPVFKLEGGGINSGAPGRNDPVFLFEADPSHLGWPVSIARAVLPTNSVLVHEWALDPSGENIARKSVSSYNVLIDGLDTSLWYAALNGPAPTQVSSAVVANGQDYSIVDSRMIARMTRFPSGERARNVTAVHVGGDFSGGRIPSAYVDELVYGSTTFGMSTPGVDPESIQGAQLLMIDNLPDFQGEQVIHVADTIVRIPSGNHGSSFKYLSDLDPEGGLLRLGNEVLAYESFDENQGTINVAEGGRALLGTEQGEHEAGSTVTFLDGYRVAILTAGIGPEDARVEVASTARFPGEGTLLIDGELIHYTRLRANSFEMPRFSSEPGKMDQRGAGMFRGRFGTEPSDHAAGTPVIFFPMRYWDRWAPMADGPELSYFGLELSQPAAFWRSFSWQEEGVGHPGVRLGVLVRSDRSIPWDSDPETTDGLDVFYRGEDDTSGNIIGTQSDGVEWRVFAEYSPEAFGVWGQESWGKGHGWRVTPRMTNFLVDYLGPAMTLRSIDR